MTENIKIKENGLYEGQIEFSTSGNANITIGTKEVFIYKKNTLNSLHMDTVRVQVYRREGKLEAKVIETISRFKTRFVGRAQVGKKTLFVVPDNNKVVVDFYIIKDNVEVIDGQKVVVELIKWEDTKSPLGRIVEVLGDSGDNNTEMNSIMHEYALPIDFPKEVLIESESVSDKISDDEIKSRRDMRGVTTLTIDPVDAKDFDDALSIDFKNGMVEVGVHIADVSHYVKPGTAIDKEAYERATSVYLVDRCVPMLPERLSNGICSLKPNEDRLAFSFVFTMDMNGSIVDTWQGKTVIHSNRRFTYEEAQQIIEGEDGDFHNEIRLLNKLAQKIRSRRIQSGSIEMDSIEVRFKLAEDNKKPIDVYFKHQKEANKLIEEFMLLANKSVAKLLSDAGQVNIYRIHDTPNMDKLATLTSICKTFGYDLNINVEGNELKKSLNKLLGQIKGTPEENMIETLVTRCMSKAIYTVKNIGHYGLGFTHYSHFTSPIRRYPDLITHRLLFDFLNKKNPGSPNKIEDQAKWCSDREIAAAKAQRDSIKYKQAEYLMDRIGNVFDGVVTGVTEWGIYVEIIENKCEGMIRLQSLPGRWLVDTDKYLAYNDSGEQIRLGDEFKITVKSIDLERKQIDFNKL